jgi:hypothetical protein
MTREEYINYPAVSASRIKRHYTGDISYAKASLNYGKDFHFALLECEYETMGTPVRNTYDAIHQVQLLGEMFDKSEKESIVVSEITVHGKTVLGKGAMDLCWDEMKIIADVKTTTAKSLQSFADDMIKHCNHVQAVWYSMLMGWNPKDFYYIGVPPKVKKSGQFKDLYLYRHNQQELDQAYELIADFLNQFDGNYGK